jgi:hypothetical protein
MTHSNRSSSFDKAGGVKKPSSVGIAPAGFGLPKGCGLRYASIHQTDPTDVLKPEVFDVNDPAWLNPDKASVIRRFCS